MATNHKFFETTIKQVKEKKKMEVIGFFEILKLQPYNLKKKKGIIIGK